MGTWLCLTLSLLWIPCLSTAVLPASPLSSSAIHMCLGGSLVIAHQSSISSPCTHQPLPLFLETSSKGDLITNPVPCFSVPIPAVSIFSLTWFSLTWFLQISHFFKSFKMGIIQLLSFTGFLRVYYNQTSLTDNYYQPFSLPEKKEPFCWFAFESESKGFQNETYSSDLSSPEKLPAIEEPCPLAASMLVILHKQDCPAVWGDPKFMQCSCSVHHT